MNPESTAVTLVVETGGRFEEVPITNGEITLGDFLDQVLKRLEVSCVSGAHTQGTPWYHGACMGCWGSMVSGQMGELVKLKMSAEAIQRAGQARIAHVSMSFEY